jgi:hypothetical protein
LDTATLTQLPHDPLVQYYISVALVMAPAVRIFMRAGLKPWIALLLLAPYVGPVLCAACLAFMKWPRLQGGKP